MTWVLVVTENTHDCDRGSNPETCEAQNVCRANPAWSQIRCELATAIHQNKLRGGDSIVVEFATMVYLDLFSRLSLAPLEQGV